MGGGFTSLADDASAVYYNPAGLPTLNYHEVSFM
jgi:long-subunit fatty acid transport protein